MATQKKAQVIITCDAKTALKVTELLQKRIEAVKAEMKGLDVTTKSGQKRFAELNKELTALNGAEKNNIKNTERINQVMKNLANTSLRDLKRALSAAKSELNKMSANDPKLKQMQGNIKALQGQIDKVTGSVHKQGGAWQTAMKNLVAYIGLFGAFNILKQKLTEIINLNMKLSDQLADIRKVSGWAMGDIDELSKRLAKIDTRNSIQQLNDLAYQGAKLGIGKYGVDGLTRFAEATAQIRMALHEDMGDEAIAQLAKMAEVMHDMEHMGVSKALLASGSAIFKLGATTTATGSNIMEFSKRLLGLGKTADLTTPQILALGSAADSMALMPEVASTAFNKFITTLQSKYTQVAKAVGMEQDKLKEMLDQHRTMDAIVAVLEHMRDMGSLDVLAPIMGDLGSEGARLTNVFASMASNVQMLKDHLATSTEEFEKATAVTAEFDIQNETAQALMERASNIWEKTFVNSENAAGGIKDLARAWYDVTKVITDSTIAMGEAGLTLKVFLWSIQGLVGAIPALIQGLVYLGAVKFANWVALSGIWTTLKAGAVSLQTSMYNLVGAQTAAQKATIAKAQTDLEAAEAMMTEAQAAIALADIKKMEALTDEEIIAAETALATATTNAAAAQQMLATAIGEVAALTGVEAKELAQDADWKMWDEIHTRNLWSTEQFLAASEAGVAAATNAQTAAIERDTLAKEKNTVASKNMKLAFGAAIFIGIVTVIDRVVDEFKKLNAEEERNKEITDKIANALATANQEYEKSIKDLRVLFDELKRNWEIQSERHRLMGEINNRYGEYIGNIVTEQTEFGNLTKAYNNATDALREYYFYKQKEALRADLVTEEKHKGDVELVKLGNMPGKYGEKANTAVIENAVKEYAREGMSVADITKQIWKDFYREDAPSNAYIDLSKMPAVGGFFPKNTFRSEAQEAWMYMQSYVESRVRAMNNEQVIENFFPGEYKAPNRPDKNTNTPHPDTHPNRATHPRGSSNTHTEDPAKQAKTDLDQLIANTKAWYDLQLAALKEMLATSDASDEEQIQAVDELTSRRRKALEAIGKTFTNGTDDWANFKETFNKDWKAALDDPQSVSLYQNIMLANLEQMRQNIYKDALKITNRTGYQAVYGERKYWKNNEEKTSFGVTGYTKVGSTSTKVISREEMAQTEMANIFAMSAGEALKDAGAAVKRMNAIRKEILEHDYTGVVDKNTLNGLEQLGFVDIDPTSPEAEKFRESVFNTLKKVRDDVAGVFLSQKKDGSIDKGGLLSFLFGDNYQQTIQKTPFSALLDLDADSEQFRLFYDKLIQYNDEYVQAMKKRSDETKKVIDYMWSIAPQNINKQRTIDKYQQWSDVHGKQPTMNQRYGFRGIDVRPRAFKPKYSEDDFAKMDIDKADKLRKEQEAAEEKFYKKEAERRRRQIQSDPELEILQLRKEAAINYYNYVIARTNDENLIREAQQKVSEAMIEQIKKEAAIIKERVDAINNFMQPTYDAIEEMGNAWAKFNESAEEGQKAMLDNLRNFIKQYAVMMIKGFRDLGEKKVRDARLQDAIDKDNANIPGVQPSDKLLKEEKRSRKRIATTEEATLNGKQNDDGSLDQEAFKNQPGIGYKNAVGEDQQNPLNPVEAAEQVHALEIDELRSFHEQMLKEEALYREMMQKLQENPEAREQIISEYQDRIEQERKLNQEQSAIRKQGFDALKKVGVAGWNALLKQEGDAQQQKTDLATTAEEGITDTEKKNQDERAQQSAQASAQSIDQMVNETIGKVVLGIAGGSAKTVGELGWWGIPLVGVISAALMGLLNYALSFIGKGSSNAKAAPNTKLVSGMLTYDNGNVQDLKPFMGADGNIYYATEDNTAHRGVNLLTKPTATTINGQPSLVAENGPELVIGRETTAAMMQNNPALLKAIYQFDRNHSSRALYDAGNLAALTASSADVAVNTQGNLIAESTQSNIALMTAINALLARLEQPINAKIDMYGRGNLYDSMGKAQAFMKGK